MKTTSERWPVSQDALSFRELLGFLYRQKVLIIFCWVLGLAGWAVALALIPAEYRVYTSFTIDADTPSGSSSADPLKEFTIRDNVGDILTAIQVMQGEDVLGQAFRNAGVTVQRVGDEYTGGPKVAIGQAGYTNLIQVTVDSPNRDQSLQIAGDIPALFATVSRRSTRDSLDKAVSFLQARQRAAGTDVQNASQAVAKFNQDLAARAGTSDPGEIASRRSQAILTSESAKADLEGAQQRLDSLQVARASVPKTIKNQTATSSTERRNSLTDLLNQLRADRAQLAVTFSANSPDVRALDAKIRANEAALKAIPSDQYVTLIARNPQLDAYDDKVAEADAAVKAARARLDRANIFLKEVEAQSLTITKGSAERSKLEGAVVERQKALDLINSNLEALQVRRNQLRDPVTVVAPPSAQDAPIRPRPTLYLAIALLASSILGIGLASLKEHIDDRVTTPELAARETGAVVLGILPPLRGREKLTLADPRMPRRMADAARLVHQRIETMYGISVNEDVRSIMLTSMSRAEERSSVSRNLAAAFASEGRSVILVSVGNTSLLETLGGYASRIGYTDLLNEPDKAESALVGTDIANVRAIARGGTNAPLTSTHIALVHERLAALADVVIYDGPSYLFPFDVQSLGSVVDATVIVVKPGVPKRNLLGVASDTLRGLRSHFLGIAITGSTTEDVTKDVVRFDDLSA